MFCYALFFVIMYKNSSILCSIEEMDKKKHRFFTLSHSSGETRVGREVATNMMKFSA